MAIRMRPFIIEESIMTTMSRIIIIKNNVSILFDFEYSQNLTTIMSY